MFWMLVFRHQTLRPCLEIMKVALKRSFFSQSGILCEYDLRIRCTNVRIKDIISANFPLGYFEEKLLFGVVLNSVLPSLSVCYPKIDNNRLWQKCLVAVYSRWDKSIS